MPLNRTARTHFLFWSIEPNAWAKQNQICKGGWASQFCSAMSKMDPPLKSTCEKKMKHRNFKDHGQSKGRVFENVPLEKNVLLKRLKSGCLRQTRTNNHSSSQKKSRWETSEVRSFKNREKIKDCGTLDIKIEKSRIEQRRAKSGRE